MNKDLDGKVALVTGGSRNIGRSAALALARKGADVVITFNKDAEAANATVAELESEGVRAAKIQANLTGTGQIDPLVSKLRTVLADWKRDSFDILINNAGILRLATFDQVTEDDLDHNFLTNYKSLFFLTQKLASMIADGGRIVNLGSRTSTIAFGPLVSYGPIKAAVQSLTLYLASFFGKRRITVNAVSPAGLDAAINAELFEQMPHAKEHLASNTSLGRIGFPTDVGGAIAFLCTQEASFISGAILNIDGGFHL